MAFVTRVLWCIVVGSVLLLVGCVTAMVYFMPLPTGGISSPSAPMPDDGWMWRLAVLGNTAGLCLVTLLVTLIVMWIREREEKGNRGGFPID